MNLRSPLQPSLELRHVARTSFRERAMNLAKTYRKVEPTIRLALLMFFGAIVVLALTDPWPLVNGSREDRAWGHLYAVIIGAIIGLVIELLNRTKARPL
jgi:hypothetical protein